MMSSRLPLRTVDRRRSRTRANEASGSLSRVLGGQALLRPGSFGKQLDQLGARVNAELPVRAAEVELDRLGAQEHPRPNLLVREPFHGRERDLELLRRQLLLRRGATSSHALAGRPQFGAGTLGPRSRAEL